MCYRIIEIYISKTLQVLFSLVPGLSTCNLTKSCDGVTCHHTKIVRYGNIVLRAVVLSLENWSGGPFSMKIWSGGPILIGENRTYAENLGPTMD